MPVLELIRNILNTTYAEFDLIFWRSFVKVTDVISFLIEFLVLENAKNDTKS